MVKNEVKRKYKNTRGRIGIAIKREEGSPSFKSVTYQMGAIVELTPEDAAKYPRGKLKLVE